MLLLVTLGLVLLAACGPKVTPVAGQIPIATPVLPTPMEERAAPTLGPPVGAPNIHIARAEPS